jgi:hypothetical protein
MQAAQIRQEAFQMKIRSTWTGDNDKLVFTFVMGFCSAIALIMLFVVFIMMLGNLL